MKMKQNKFFSKSYNLNELKKKKLSNFIIPKFYFFRVGEWLKKKEKIIQDIHINLSKLICVRSSFLGEDTLKSSLAGKFNSYIKIKNNKKNLVKYINLIIKQYNNFDIGKNLNHEILIQEFVKNNICSGVMTNFCISDGSPYYTINYDDVSKSTESVTSGNKDSFRVLYVNKNNITKLRNQNFRKLIKCFKTIEKAYQKIPLDLEFSIDKDNNINILQIRPISKKISWPKINKKKFEKRLEQNKKKYQVLKKKFSDQKDLIFSSMSDWNPAEMIGAQPEYLSYSLYDYFITQDSWFIARKEMGYGTGKIQNLMENFLGKPYINLNLSFNSLIPADVNKKIRKKLIKNWLNKIRLKPYLHDKIEFEIAQNCFYFGIDKDLKKNIDISDKEKKLFNKILINHTNELIINFALVSNHLIKNLINLENIRESIVKENLSKREIEIIIVKLSNKLKIFGIIPFSKFARYAFIGKKILLSLVQEKIIKISSYNRILRSIDTVSKDFVSDKKKLQRKKIKINYFNKLYYHLRPGTYDIKSKRYHEKLNNYNIKTQITKILNLKKIDLLNFFNKNEIKNINKILKNKKLNFDLKHLVFFIINSIRLRENSKFIFTRTLSDIIEMIKNINLEDKENIDFKLFLKRSKNKFELGRSKRKLVFKIFSDQINRSAKLPYLIQSSNDFFVSSILISKPNFITESKLKSKIVYLKKGDDKKEKLDKKIVLIENADPGYDWIFTHKIKGIITKFGGVNSHMSIRCEEKQLPAIIGVGEEIFEKINKQNFLEIDCKLQKINLIN